MIREMTLKHVLIKVVPFYLCFCLMFASNALGGDELFALKMPEHWKVITDVQVHPDQVKAMSRKLGANLINVRNTIYDVRGKRIQINTIATGDSKNAEKLIIKLQSIKSEEAMLRKNLIIYEFVGKNDVLPIIAEGRKYLESM